MTLITAFIAGIAAGLIARTRNTAYRATTIAVVAVLALQSALPLVKKTSFSLSDPGYWASQVVILAGGLLLATGANALRHRRETAH